MTILACSCGKSYDVKGREPGTKVRCRACQRTLVIPAPRAKPSAAVRTASERLRAARGEPCPKHRRQLATEHCELCARPMCLECIAPKPSSHLCRTCAPKVGATEALALDFGALATPLVAAKLIARALPRLVAFNVASDVAKYVCVLLPLAIAIAIYAPYTTGSAKIVPDEIPWRFVAAVAVAAIGLVVIGFFDLVLKPAGDVLILDATLRDKPLAFGDALKDAASKAWTKKGPLVLAFLLLIAACMPAILVWLPFVLAGTIAFEGEPMMADEVMSAGALLAIAVLGATLGAFGLAIPAVVLEHRSASAAFGRAWALARLHPGAAFGFGIFFVTFGLVLFFGGITISNAGAGHAVGIVLTWAFSFLFDLAWPAILVSAYHGLVAEEARVLGRRS